MKKMSQVLIESQTTRVQTTGRLINNTTKVKDIHQYCALGALACEMQLFSEKQSSYHEDETYLIQPTQSEILRAYDIESILDENIECSYCDGSYDEDYNKNGIYLSRDLSDYIVHLNDYHLKTFEEIGKDLEARGY